MFAILIAATLAAPGNATPSPEFTLKDQPVRECRIISEGASRSSDVTICRAKAQWRKRDLCRGVTRYCSPQQKAEMFGKRTAFSLSEDSRIVCRVLLATGSRLSTERVCLPNREWQRMWDDSSSTTPKLQDQSTRVRDQQ